MHEKSFGRNDCLLIRHKPIRPKRFHKRSKCFHVDFYMKLLLVSPEVNSIELGEHTQQSTFSRTFQIILIVGPTHLSLLNCFPDKDPVSLLILKSSSFLIFLLLHAILQLILWKSIPGTIRINTITCTGQSTMGMCSEKCIISSSHHCAASWTSHACPQYGFLKQSNVVHRNVGAAAEISHAISQ